MLFRCSKAASPVVIAVFGAWFGLGGCENYKPGYHQDPTGSFTPSSISVAVGEEVTFKTTSTASENLLPYGCRGIAEVSTGFEKKVRGLAVGQCSVELELDDGVARQTKAATLAISVTAPTDGGAKDAANEAGPTPLCSATVAKVGEYNGRDIYKAYTDVASGNPNQACPIHTSTSQFMGDITFGFLAGSPGYTIEGPAVYAILSASPAVLSTDPGPSRAEAFEDQDQTITFQRRLAPGEEAGPPPIWTMKFRMVSNPDPAKWRVDLYSFGKL